MIESKIWLCGLASEKTDLESIKELIEPIHEFFDGLVWTYHGEDSAILTYLESRKGEGHIERCKWYGRYDFARNHYLFCGKIQEYDWFLNIDDCERLSVEFCRDELKPLIVGLAQQGVDGVYLHNKIFMFCFNEWMKFKNSVHETIEGCSKAIELTSVEKFQNSERYFQNARSSVREPYEFVDKYLRYYLTLGSIHCLLGCEKNIPLYQERMKKRHEFRFICRSMGIPLTVEGIYDYMKAEQGCYPENLKEIFNFEKILNDFYRYHICGLRDFKDDHNRKNMVAVA